MLTDPVMLNKYLALASELLTGGPRRFFMAGGLDPELPPIDLIPILTHISIIL